MVLAAACSRGRLVVRGGARLPQRSLMSEYDRCCFVSNRCLLQEAKNGCAAALACKTASAQAARLTDASAIIREPLLQAAAFAAWDRPNNCRATLGK